MSRIVDLDARPRTDWVRLDGALPAAGEALLLGRERFLREGPELAVAGIRVGVSLPPDAEIESLASYLPVIDLIELEFPDFADGRAFTQARELRERFAFDGDIRAVGEVLRDQLGFMVRCGFSQFDLSREEDFSIAEALTEIRHGYQPC